MSKRLGGIIGCKPKPLYGIKLGSLMVVTKGQWYHVGEKPTVIQYTYIIYRDAGTPSKTKTKDTMSLYRAQFFTLGLGSDGWHHHYITVFNHWLTSCKSAELASR